MKLTQEELQGIERNITNIVDNGDGWYHFHLDGGADLSYISMKKKNHIFSDASYYAKWNIGGEEIKISNAEEVYEHSIGAVERYNARAEEEAQKIKQDKFNKARQNLISHIVDRYA